MLHLEITTPERTVYQEDVDSVTIPTREGEITVLPHHASLVGLVVPGALTLRTGSKERYVAVAGGALEVLPGSKCVILTDSADRAEELIVEQIEEAKKRAHEALVASRNTDSVAFADASALMERELARVKVAHKHRRGRASVPEKFDI
jgi:F-type H+-transporting ATPase subunit epsilon